MRHLFITGTDTGVGKTYFTSWLLRQWVAQQRACVGLKPLATGDRSDAEALATAAGQVWPEEKINPLFFREPATPLSAARAEGKSVDLALAAPLIAEARQRFTHVAVEGVGGWRAPLAPGITVQEWAQTLDLRVVVVARAGLGTLNHTLLTLDAISAAGLECAGVVLNHGLEAETFSSRTNAAVLREWTAIPVWEFTAEMERSGVLPPWLA